MPFLLQLYFFSLFWVASYLIFAQDVHFSQFYANPLYLNPALTGTTGQGRFLFNFRSQFPALEGEFVSYNASYDQYFARQQSSLGILISTDKAGSAGLRSTNISLQYAYTVPLSSFWAMRGGLQAGYGNRSVEYFKLVFGDQLAPTGLLSRSSQDTYTSGLNVYYLDLGAGIAFYKENFWLSIAAHHLNRPNQSLTGQTPELLAPKYSLQTGYKIIGYTMGARRKEGYSYALHPMINYSQQAHFQQLDLGLQTYFKPVTFGAFVRSLPLKPNLNTNLSLSSGFKYKGLNILYSYDFPISSIARSLGGAHEFTLCLQTEDHPPNRKKIKKRKRKKINIVNFPSLID
ncbi:MAG: PorP/SprF family type IX secretion system membrane protein [Microscillaceae bacterium]|nr:PorP/SprF family type IX secretion system membrane protein [Microscillaceae bacterium]MDW8461947.1 PorP/SprF family type IX secretion system membrane protein [Cytophagales bacterium]